ncbi:oxidoreductase [Ancrocorticia sp.]
MRTLTTMTSEYERILEPITLGNLELSNRVIMLPMGSGLGTPEGLFSDREIAYYTERAAGGTALVITAACQISDEFEAPNPHLPALFSDAALPSMKKLVDSIHSVGGKLSFQLTPGQGRNADLSDLKEAPVSASAVPAFGDPNVMSRGLEIDEIHLLVQRMVEASVRAASVGADAIDIHGHTGYLVDQFLSKQWNHREDEYGGSTENRCRFVVEIIQGIKQAIPGFPVSIRLSVDQRFEGGRTAEESVKIAQELERAGVDLILADDGSYEAMDYVFPPYYLGDGCMVSAARILKDAVSIPVVACGNLDLATATDVLAAGDADLIGLGRGLIADPQWVAKLSAGRPGDIRPCIRCNAMCIGGVLAGDSLGCAVNPEAGRELDRRIVKADNARKVAIVGGGPAGLEAARVASEEGHQVDLYERADKLGGVLLPAATPDFKRELFRMIGWWEGQLEDSPVNVHLSHDVSPDDQVLEGADHIIVATGSKPLVPGAIPGIDGPNVVEVIEAHEGAPLGRRVVVAGGGLSGADLALELAEAGHAVSIVEMADDIARDMLAINRITLLRELDRANVTLYTGHRVTSVTADGVTTTAVDGEHTIPADTVISAFGVLPNVSLTKALEDRGIEVQAIGDCVQPAKVGEAIHAGYLAASSII